MTNPVELFYGYGGQIATNTTRSMQFDNNNNLTTNLPSTFVKEKNSSILNSILVAIVLVVIIIGFWFLKNSGLNFFVLINFFLQEFYFNLNMIISNSTIF